MRWSHTVETPLLKPCNHLWLLRAQNIGFGVRLRSTPNLLVVQPWISYLSFLNLSFHSCRMGKMPIPESCWNSRISLKCLVPYFAPRTCLRDDCFCYYLFLSYSSEQLERPPTVVYKCLSFWNLNKNKIREVIQSHCRKVNIYRNMNLRILSPIPFPSMTTMNNFQILFCTWTILKIHTISFRRMYIEYTLVQSFSRWSLS